RAQGIRHRVGYGGSRADGTILTGTLDPQRVDRRGVVLAEVDVNGRDLAGGGQEVVHEAAGHELPLAVIGEVLEQGRSHPLRRAAHDLSVHELRIDGAADVVLDQVAQDFD